MMQARVTSLGAASSSLSPCYYSPLTPFGGGRLPSTSRRAVPPTLQRYTASARRVDRKVGRGIPLLTSTANEAGLGRSGGREITLSVDGPHRTDSGTGSRRAKWLQNSGHGRASHRKRARWSAWGLVRQGGGREANGAPGTTALGLSPAAEIEKLLQASWLAPFGCAKAPKLKKQKRVYAGQDDDSMNKCRFSSRFWFRSLGLTLRPSIFLSVGPPPPRTEITVRKRRCRAIQLVVILSSETVWAEAWTGQGRPELTSREPRTPGSSSDPGGAPPSTNDAFIDQPFLLSSLSSLARSLPSLAAAAASPDCCGTLAPGPYGAIVIRVLGLHRSPSSVAPYLRRSRIATACCNHERRGKACIAPFGFC